MRSPRDTVPKKRILWCCILRTFLLYSFDTKGEGYSLVNGKMKGEQEELWSD